MDSLKSRSDWICCQKKLFIAIHKAIAQWKWAESLRSHNRIMKEIVEININFIWLSLSTVTEKFVWNGLASRRTACVPPSSAFVRLSHEISLWLSIENGQSYYFSPVPRRSSKGESIKSLITFFNETLPTQKNPISGNLSPSRVEGKEMNSKPFSAAHFCLSSLSFRAAWAQLEMLFCCFYIFWWRFKIIGSFRFSLHAVDRKLSSAGCFN